jgi:hypothetical protein
LQTKIDSNYLFELLEALARVERERGALGAGKAEIPAAGLFTHGRARVF